MIKRRAPLLPFIITSSVFLLILIGLFAWFNSLSSSSVAPINQISSIGTNQTNAYKILKPATVASKTPECSASLTYDSNGNPSPIQCNNGGLNTQAWNALAALEPIVMKLGYNPTQSQVTAAICTDGNAANASSTPAIAAPIETTAYQLATLYYGWHFSIDPTALITGGGC